MTGQFCTSFGRRMRFAKGKRYGIEELENRRLLSVTGLFELDANATTGVLGTAGSTTPSHDWDQVFADNNAGTPVSGAIASAFMTDATNSAADDVFVGDGSKDTRGIQAGPWLSAQGKPSPKTDISHAYAALYVDPNNGHQILSAGLDRFDNSGSATAGFWFFRNAVTAAAPGATGTPFAGAHSDGDILLVSDFSQGGSTSIIKLFRWTGDDATGGLQPITNLPAGVFAIANNAPISVPWSFTDKSGAHQPGAGEFLEAGVDLTDLGLGGSFVNFMAETRAAQNPTATLSDFVIGRFVLNSLAAPQFTGLSKVGDSITYPLTVQNTGARPLFIQSVSDTLLGNIVTNHTLQQPGAAGVNPFVTSVSSAFDFSQPLAPGASLTVFVTRTVQTADPDPTNSTATFTGTDDLAGSGAPVTTSVTNTVNLFQPSAALTVTASPDSATSLGQPITYTYTVNNTSSADSPNLILSTADPLNSFTDTLLGDLEATAITANGGGNMAPGASFTFTSTRNVQAGDPTPLTNNATATFTLAQNLGSFDNLITAAASSSVTLVPHLVITKAVTPGFPDVIHPGDTASFTITVTNDGAGPATNVSVTDQLPAPQLLTWSATSSSFTTSISSFDFLTATSSSVPAGATQTITVSAAVPLDVFGIDGPANGHSIPLGLFELDGNATTGVLGTSGSTTPSHDWDQVFADHSNGSSTSGAIASSFVTDPTNGNDDIHTGGGSKDTLGIQAGPRLFTNSKPQGKDDIAHAFASMYIDPATGDRILYCGMDRFDNSGDTTAGFWFFQNPIGKSTNSPPTSGASFTGTHTDGDIFLVSDFTVGGAASTITVFRWTGNDSTGSLVPVNNGNPIFGSSFAIVNSGPTTVPWPYEDKSHRTVPAAGEFLEQGVNLSALGLESCFTTFLAETRSSQSPTATLSDFVIGSFNTCRIDLLNQATVQASGIEPLASNQSLITILDGDEDQVLP